MSRRFEILGTEMSFDLPKVVSVDVPKKMIVFEEMPNGKWRLTYTKSLIPELTKVSGIIITQGD